MNFNDFEKHMLQYIERVKVLNERLFEIAVFEKELNTIFTIAKQNVKRKHQIKIQNIYAYRAFRWDKYQVILSDILSLCDNELKYKNSITQIMYKFIDYNLDKLGEHRKIYFIKYIKDIYNVKYSEIKMSDNDNKSITGKFSKFRKWISDERQYLSHKYDSDVINKYESNLKESTKILDQLKLIMEYLITMAKGMYFLCNHDDFDFNFCKSRKYVMDQIDIIFFSNEDFFKCGSIIHDHNDEHRRIDFYRKNINKIIMFEK